ncbi:MAG: hypothetical protein HOL98_07525 [Gammaproteobacteria bacterium]|jgi:hypothetical protein|nr:hypothetical protein [Gammaproteobacteria bacterium]MBT5203289.1 hypothetical protein [Gammaproteobacteria bacterium]MBT5603400.1 hypothetical protein [Gammaproteobacteria bacterium]MBT6244260.1 hypothetical protein [Gammaproteobacteria bacterium]
MKISLFYPLFKLAPAGYRSNVLALVFLAVASFLVHQILDGLGWWYYRFGRALIAMVFGISYLHVERWIKTKKTKGST